MPSNLSFLDTNFPSFTDEDSTEKKINTIQDYLYMTVESLRYALSHLNEGNMEQNFADTIIKGNGSLAKLEKVVGDHTASITALVEVTGDQSESIAQLNLNVSENTASIVSHAEVITEHGESISEISQEVDSQSSKISLVVSTSGSTNTVNTASIVAAVNNAGSSIKINADKIDISGSVKFLTPDDVGASGSTTIDGGRISTGSISFNRLNSSTQTTINNASTNASNAVETANSADGKASGILTNWGYVYQGETYINGEMLLTGSVTASKIRGGTVYLIDENENEAGIISITNATSGNFAIDLYSDAALRFRANSGNIFLGAKESAQSDDAAWVQIYDDGYVKISPSLVYANYGTSEPGANTPGNGVNGALYFKYNA